MSGHWEVVGKKKSERKLGNSTVSNNKETHKKKEVNLNVKVEDVLAKSYVSHLYQDNKKKENKIVDKPKITKEVANANKTKQKSQPKVSELPKIKPPKTIESALNLIDVSEFENLFAKSKIQFPDAPIVWLKELSQFLNQRVSIDLQDPVFTSKPRNYPKSVIPAGILKVMEDALKAANRNNVQLFFDITLTSMATDMSKNLPGLGHKLFLQYIALSEPKLIMENLNKHIVLRNSYQNRSNIGLSILWAVGQCGQKDFIIGLSIFQELMLPLIELKNYSRFVVQYLLDLIKTENIASVTKEQYLLILETIFADKKNFPNDLKPELLGALSNVKLCLLKQKHADLDSYVEYFLNKSNLHVNNGYQSAIFEVIAKIFIASRNSQIVWKQLYAKNVKSSSKLLIYLVKNWNLFKTNLNTKDFKSVLITIQEVNYELLQKRRKEEGLSEAVDSIEKLQKAMATKKKSSSSGKFIFFSLLLLGAAGLYIDVNQHGGWKESLTRKTLIQLRVCEYCSLAVKKVNEGLTFTNDAIRERFPEEHKAIAIFAEPYWNLGRDLSKIGWNMCGNIKDFVIEKYPIVRQSVETYAPGLVEQSQTAVYNAWTFSVVHFNQSVDYLKKEVFVGQLSPENMQKVVLEALNTTQIKASEYYNWLYEKVQTSMK